MCCVKDSWIVNVYTIDNSSAFQTPKQVVSKAWFIRLGGGAGDESNVGFFCYRMQGLTLVGEIFGCMCGLSPTWSMNNQNVGFIKEVTHILIALKVWVEMWCLRVLWSQSIGWSLVFTSLTDSPTVRILCGLNFRKLQSLIFLHQTNTLCSN